MFVILVTILCALFIYFYVFKPHQYWKNLNVPHVKPWPLLGNMGRIFLRIEGFHDWALHLYNTQKTKLMGIYSFNIPILFVRDLDLIKKITVKQFDHFADHRHLASEDIDPIFGKNLLNLKGEKWRNMRSTLSPAFTSSKMKSMFVLMSDCALQYKEYFSNLVHNNTILDIELTDIFTRFTNDVIATTAFGIECNSLKNKNNEFYLMGKEATTPSLLRVITVFMYYINKRLMRLLKLTVFGPKVNNFFRNIIKTTIEVRENKKIVRPDMIHLLMEARKGKLKHEMLKDDDAGFATVNESEIGKNSRLTHINLSDDDITAQALLFFFGGFDTVSKAMIFTAYELAFQPEIQKKLQKEIDEALEKCNGELSYEILMQMKYLDMVISETLRKWPPFPIMDRMCTIPFTIKAEDADGQDIHIEKDKLVWIPIYAIHHDPKYYPNPDKFDPERFNEQNKEKINPMAYLPFGSGPRNCIGSRFALMEVKIIIASILSEFSIVFTARSNVPPVLKAGDFTLNIVNGLWVGLQRRNEKSS